MKYNPFKPHIVLHTDGYYYIRRWQYLWWQYLWILHSGEVRWDMALFRIQVASWWNTEKTAKEKLEWLKSYTKTKLQVIL